MTNVHLIESSDFSRNLSKTVKDLYEHKQFSDVTLISEDLKQVPAHKFILSSCSSFFAKILINLNHHQPIFVKGLQAEDMDYLLQYCYLGQVRMPFDCIEKFMTLLKDFDVWNVKNNIDDHKALNDDIGEMCEAILKEENEELKEETEQKALTEVFEQDSKSNNNYKVQDSSKEDDQGTIDWTEVEEELNEDYPESYKDEKVKEETKENCPNNSEKLKIKKEERSLACDTCGYIATRYSSLKNHKKVTHLGLRNYLPCEICGKTLGGRGALLTHISMIHDKFVYKCEVENCNYSVKTKIALDQHTQSVHEGKEYFCDSCPKKFNKRTQFKKHYFLIHTDAPMLSCEKCDFKTKSKERLKKHTAAHEGKKISCSKCDFKTVWSYNLNDHMRKVHKQPVIKCESCPFSSVSEAAVKTHVKHTHFQTTVFKAEEN